MSRVGENCSLHADRHLDPFTFVPKATVVWSGVLLFTKISSLNNKLNHIFVSYVVVPMATVVFWSGVFFSKISYNEASLFLSRNEPSIDINHVEYNH